MGDGANDLAMIGRAGLGVAYYAKPLVAVAAGASIDGADAQGRTAAHGAALWGLTDVIRFLHDNGLALHIRDKRGYTALDTALGLAGGFGFGARAGTQSRKVELTDKDVKALQDENNAPYVAEVVPSVTISDATVVYNGATDKGPRDHP